MQLKQLLQFPQFKQIKVVNAKADLSTNVTTIGMMEAPDIAEYVVKGQLLVTTGYHFVHNLPGLNQLIQTMHNKGAAAIGIKARRYFDQIPPEIIKAADKVHFPILLLPANIGLSVIVRNLLHTVLQQQTDQLSQVMNDTLAISKYILAERSDNEILDQINQRLHCDIFIIDSFGRLKAKNRTAIVNPALFEFTTTQLDLLNLKSMTVIMDQYLIYPLKTVNKLTSRFVIFNLAVIHDSAQQLLIENMVNLLSMENLQVGININDDRQRESEFFETLLSKSISDDTFSENLDFKGLAVADQFKAIAVDEANSIDTGNHQFQMHKIANYIYWFFEKIEVPIVVINWHFKIYVLVKTTDAILPMLTQLLALLTTNFPTAKVKIGFTNYQKQLLNFKALLDEADEALEIAKRRDQDQPTEFRPKQVDAILTFIPPREAQMFINEVLAPLLQLEANERTPLLELLEQYFAENQSLSRAADNLFLHRNTAVYRLKKVEKLLQIHFKDPKEVEQLAMAVRLNVLHHAIK